MTAMRSDGMRQRLSARSTGRCGRGGVRPCCSGCDALASVCARLAIHELRSPARTGASGAVREIPLDAITGSVEPNRATLFDREFRPSLSARSRWLSVWHAEQRGAGLPPISVVAVDDGYAVRDGHHRVSVARSRGALSIAAAIA